MSCVGLIGSNARADWATETLAGMTVEVYTPDSASPVGSGRALMLVLHGCTQQASALRTEGNLEAAADAMGVVMAVPNVPGGGVVAGCWDYYGASHSRTSGHNGPVLDMVDDLLDDAALDIDPDQIYVVGFSSGGGQAQVLGCVAPDVFAGIGVVAGPTLGTGVADIAMVATSAGQAATVCEQLAGEYSPHLQTQAAITFADSADFTVSTGYNAVNAGMFAAVMSDGIEAMQAEAIDFASLPGSAPAGVGTAYADASGVRVALLDSTSGVGHAWPSGSGMAGGLLSYVNGNGLDMGQYAAEFFAMHNPRVDAWDPGGTGSGGETDSGGSGGESMGSGGSSGGDDSSDPSGGDSSPSGDSGAGSGATTITGGTNGGVTGADDPTGPGLGGCSVPGSRGSAAGLWLLTLLGLRRRR